MYHADSHCDSLTEAIQKGVSLYKNSLQCDLHRLLESKPFLQYFAIFLDPDIYKDRTIDDYIFFINKLDMYVEEYELIKVTDSYSINEMLENNSVAALYSIEGLDCVHSVEDLERLFNKGIRCVSLTWNHGNQLAAGVESVIDSGLTDLGRKVIRKAEQLGMIIDVSHLSQKSFYDIIEMSSLPLIASHSNARALCNHPRNLTDEQILLIAERRGYIGVNLYPAFLINKHKIMKAKASDVADHIVYINDLSGNNICGMGCDFDGINLMPVKFTGVESIHLVALELKIRDYSKSDIAKILGENLIRFTHYKLGL